MYYIKKKKKEPKFEKTMPRKVVVCGKVIERGEPINEKEVKPKKKAAKPKTKPLKHYIDKLDRVFSKYIRLRDARPYRYLYCKCISCGQVKEYDKFDCGHYFSRRHMATRFDEENCHAECSHCLTPDALILTEDFYWKRLGDIKEGDRLFGFDEEVKVSSRCYRVATVTHIHRDVQDVYEVELENGDKIKTTAEHKWLVRNRAGVSYQWLETQNLWVNGVNVHGKHKTGPHTSHVTTKVCKPFLVVEREDSYESGWIAGMIDADGHVTQQNIHNPDGSIRYGFRVGVAQCEKYMDICEHIKRALEHFTGNDKICRQWVQRKNDKKRGIVSKYQTWQFLITGTNVEKLQFLMRTRPHKINKVNLEKLGKLKSQYDTHVKAVRYVGKEEIVVMETDTHTFIANGYAMHNCNRFSADHLVGYHDNLILKIGKQRYDLLCWKKTQIKKWTVFELEAMIKYYESKVAEFENEKANIIKR